MQELLETIDQQAKLISDQGERLYNIEKALITIAVQEEKIGTIQTQVSTLWIKYDNILGSVGTVVKLQTQLQAQVASCPKADIKSAITGQWVAIGIIVALIGALKLWG